MVSDVELAGRRVDVAVGGGVVVGIEPVGTGPMSEDVLDGGGGAVLPGVHDHHVHLLATAAAAPIRC